MFLDGRTEAVSPLPERFGSFPLVFLSPQYQLGLTRSVGLRLSDAGGHVICVCDTQSIFLDGRFITSTLFLYTTSTTTGRFF